MNIETTTVPRRVLVVHNRYQIAGGEDSAVDGEIRLLRARGHHVDVALEDNDSIAGFGAKLKTLAAVRGDSRRAEWMRALLEDTRSDIVHIHNFFPRLTPSIHAAAAQTGAAVVQTLHNYRMICANALLLRGGRVCEKCVGGSGVHAVMYRCYRGSVAGSAAVVGMQHAAFRSGGMVDSVHRFIALTEFAQGRFVAGGLPVDRIAIKPNFVEMSPAPGTGRNGYYYAGRLSEEKGVAILVEAWRHVDPGCLLTIAGDGPERASLEAAAPSNVRFVGRVDRAAVATLASRSKALILPSICYEGFPMTAVEAFAAGTPVVASRLGSLAEIVEPGVTGAHFRVGDSQDLARVVAGIERDGEEFARMGINARALATGRYGPMANVLRLEAIYDEAMDLARHRLPA